MKYTLKTIINRRRALVAELFDSWEHASQWQTGFIGHQHLSGTEGSPGAKTELTYEIKGRKMTMVETIVKRDLPEVFISQYTTPGMWNEVKIQFEATKDKQTTYTVTSEFKGQSIMMKLFIWLAPGQFKKQTQKMMDDFNHYCTHYKEVG